MLDFEELVDTTAACARHWHDCQETSAYLLAGWAHVQAYPEPEAEGVTYERVQEINRIVEENAQCICDAAAKWAAERVDILAKEVQGLADRARKDRVGGHMEMILHVVMDVTTLNLVSWALDVLSEKDFGPCLAVPADLFTRNLQYFGVAARAAKTYEDKLIFSVAGHTAPTLMYAFRNILQLARVDHPDANPSTEDTREPDLLTNRPSVPVVKTDPKEDIRQRVYQMGSTTVTGRQAISIIGVLCNSMDSDYCQEQECELCRFRPSEETFKAIGIVWKGDYERSDGV